MIDWMDGWNAGNVLLSSLHRRSVNSICLVCSISLDYLFSIIDKVLSRASERANARHHRRVFKLSEREWNHQDRMTSSLFNDFLFPLSTCTVITSCSFVRRARRGDGFGYRSVNEWEREKGKERKDHWNLDKRQSSRLPSSSSSASSRRRPLASFSTLSLLWR